LLALHLVSRVLPFLGKLIGRGTWILQSEDFEGIFKRGDTDRPLHVVFFSPHDDDACLGAGILIWLLRHLDVEVTIVIVTDGRQGYWESKLAEQIAAIRKEETIEAYAGIGIDQNHLIFLDFPDAQLHTVLGRRTAFSIDGKPISSGMQDAFTKWLRKLRPTHVFLPTFNDLHPDHKWVYQEVMICLFHALGLIWEEDGEPVGQIEVFQFPVYCKLPEPHTHELRSTEEVKAIKIRAIGVWAKRSQKQIASLEDRRREEPPAEIFLRIDFSKVMHDLKRTRLFLR